MNLQNDNNYYFDILNKALGKQPSDGTQDIAAVRAIISHDILTHSSANDYLAYTVRKMAMNFCEDIILPNLRYSMFISSSWMLSPLLQNIDFNHEYELILKAKVQRVQERPVIYKIVPSFDALPNDVHSCRFCGGYTKNDMRGHCCACGAPRSDRL